MSIKKTIAGIVTGSIAVGSMASGAASASAASVEAEAGAEAFGTVDPQNATDGAILADEPAAAVASALPRDAASANVPTVGNGFDMLDPDFQGIFDLVVDDIAWKQLGYVSQESARFLYAPGDLGKWGTGFSNDNSDGIDVLDRLKQQRDAAYDAWKALRAQAEAANASASAVPSSPGIEASVSGVTPRAGETASPSPTVEASVTPSPAPTGVPSVSPSPVSPPQTGVDNESVEVGVQVSSDLRGRIDAAWDTYKALADQVSVIEEQRAKNGSVAASGPLGAADWDVISGMTIYAGDLGLLPHEGTYRLNGGAEGAKGDAYAITVPNVDGQPVVSLIILPKGHPFSTIPRGTRVNYTYDGLKDYYPALAERIKKIDTYVRDTERINEFYASGGKLSMDLPAIPTATAPQAIDRDLWLTLDSKARYGTGSTVGFAAAIDANRSDSTKRVFVINQPQADYTPFSADRQDFSRLDYELAPYFCYVFGCFKTEQTGRINRGYLVTGRWTNPATGRSGELYYYVNPNRSPLDGTRQPWQVDSGTTSMSTTINVPPVLQDPNVKITWTVSSYHAPYDKISTEPGQGLLDIGTLKGGSTVTVGDIAVVIPDQTVAPRVGGAAPTSLDAAIPFTHEMWSSTTAGGAPTTPETHFGVKLTPASEDAKRFTMARLRVPNPDGTWRVEGIYINRSGSGFDLVLPRTAPWLPALEVSADNGTTWAMTANGNGSSQKKVVRTIGNPVVAGLKYTDGVITWDKPTNGDKVYAYLPSGMVDVTDAANLRVPANVAGSTIYFERVTVGNWGLVTRGKLSPIHTYLGNQIADSTVKAGSIALSEAKVADGWLKAITIRGIDSRFKYLRIATDTEGAPRGVYVRVGDDFRATTLAGSGEEGTIDYRYAVSVDGKTWTPLSIIGADVTRTKVAHSLKEIDVLPSALTLRMANGMLSWGGMVAGEWLRIYAAGTVYDAPVGATSWTIPTELRGSTLWVALVSDGTLGRMARVDTGYMIKDLRSGDLASGANEYSPVDIAMTPAAQQQIVAEYDAAVAAWAKALGGPAPSTNADGAPFRVSVVGPSLTMTVTDTFGKQAASEFISNFRALTNTSTNTFKAFSGTGVNAWGLTTSEANALATLGRNTLVNQRAQIMSSTGAFDDSLSFVDDLVGYAGDAVGGLMMAAQLAYTAYDILDSTGMLTTQPRMYPSAITRSGLLNAAGLANMLTLPEANMDDLLSSVEETANMLRAIQGADTSAELKAAIETIMQGVESRTKAFREGRSPQARIDWADLTDAIVIDDVPPKPDDEPNPDAPNDDSDAAQYALYEAQVLIQQAHETFDALDKSRLVREASKKLNGAPISPASMETAAELRELLDAEIAQLAATAIGEATQAAMNSSEANAVLDDAAGIVALMSDSSLKSQTLSQLDTVRSYWAGKDVAAQVDAAIANILEKMDPETGMTDLDSLGAVWESVADATIKSEIKDAVDHARNLLRARWTRLLVDWALRAATQTEALELLDRASELANAISDTSRLDTLDIVHDARAAIERAEQTSPAEKAADAITEAKLTPLVESLRGEITAQEAREIVSQARAFIGTLNGSAEIVRWNTALAEAMSMFDEAVADAVRDTLAEVDVTPSEARADLLKKALRRSGYALNEVTGRDLAHQVYARADAHDQAVAQQVREHIIAAKQATTVEVRERHLALATNALQTVADLGSNPNGSKSLADLLRDELNKASKFLVDDPIVEDERAEDVEGAVQAILDSVLHGTSDPAVRLASLLEARDEAAFITDSTKRTQMLAAIEAAGETFDKENVSALEALLPQVYETDNLQKGEALLAAMRALQALLVSADDAATYLGVIQEAERHLYGAEAELRVANQIRSAIGAITANMPFQDAHAVFDTAFDEAEAVTDTALRNTLIDEIQLQVDAFDAGIVRQITTHLDAATSVDAVTFAAVQRQLDAALDLLDAIYGSATYNATADRIDAQSAVAHERLGIFGETELRVSESVTGLLDSMPSDDIVGMYAAIDAARAEARRLVPGTTLRQSLLSQIQHVEDAIQRDLFDAVGQYLTAATSQQETPEGAQAALRKAEELAALLRSSNDRTRAYGAIAEAGSAIADSAAMKDAVSQADLAQIADVLSKALDHLDAADAAARRITDPKLSSETLTRISAARTVVRDRFAAEVSDTEAEETIRALVANATGNASLLQRYDAAEQARRALMGINDETLGLELAELLANAFADLDEQAGVEIKRLVTQAYLAADQSLALRTLAHARALAERITNPTQRAGARDEVATVIDDIERVGALGSVPRNRPVAHALGEALRRMGAADIVITDPADGSRLGLRPAEFRHYGQDAYLLGQADFVHGSDAGAWDATLDPDDIVLSIRRTPAAVAATSDEWSAWDRLSQLTPVWSRDYITIRIAVDGSVWQRIDSRPGWHWWKRITVTRTENVVVGGAAEQPIEEASQAQGRMRLIFEGSESNDAPDTVSEVSESDIDVVVFNGQVFETLLTAVSATDFATAVKARVSALEMARSAPAAQRQALLDRVATETGKLRQRAWDAVESHQNRALGSDSLDAALRQIAAGRQVLLALTDLGLDPIENIVADQTRFDIFEQWLRRRFAPGDGGGPGGPGGPSGPGGGLGDGLVRGAAAVSVMAAPTGEVGAAAWAALTAELTTAAEPVRNLVRLGVAASWSRDGSESVPDGSLPEPGSIDEHQAGHDVVIDASEVAPEVESVEYASATVVVGQPVGVKVGQVSGWPEPLIAFQWFESRDGGSTFVAVAGARSATYVPTKARATYVVVTVMNALGATFVTLPVLTPVAVSAPVSAPVAVSAPVSGPVAVSAPVSGPVAVSAPVSGPVAVSAVTETASIRQMPRTPVAPVIAVATPSTVTVATLIHELLIAAGSATTPVRAVVVTPTASMSARERAQFVDKVRRAVGRAGLKGVKVRRGLAAKGAGLRLVA